MKRQLRLDLRTKNFNFEEFNRFTQRYEKARGLDIERSREFYKLVKYVKSKANLPENEIINYRIVQDFMAKYRVDLIENPEEF